MLQKIFIEDDRNRIRKIPTSVAAVKDRLYWAESATREFTVQSGYRLAKTIQRERKEKSAQEGTISRNEAGSECWKYLWNLNMNENLKVFIWKCLKVILPVNAIVKNRCGKGDRLYKCCREYPETVEHMLF